MIPPRLVNAFRAIASAVRADGWRMFGNVTDSDTMGPYAVFRRICSDGSLDTLSVLYPVAKGYECDFEPFITGAVTFIRARPIESLAELADPYDGFDDDDPDAPPFDIGGDPFLHTDEWHQEEVKRAYREGRDRGAADARRAMEEQYADGVRDGRRRTVREQIEGPGAGVQDARIDEAFEIFKHMHTCERSEVTFAYLDECIANEKPSLARQGDDDHDVRPAATEEDVERMKACPHGQWLDTDDARVVKCERCDMHARRPT